MKSETIFITGTTGYLGNAIALKCAEQGYPVKALVRDPKKIAQTPESFQHNPAISIVEGNLLKPESYQEKLKNCDYLIHTAALVKVWVKDRSLFYKTNVDAMEQLFLTAHLSGIKKIIYVSSFFALGPSTLGRPCTEFTVHEPNHFHNDYEKSKFLGDQKTIELIGKGLPIVRIYPAIIYGPGMITEGNLVARLIIEYLQGKAIGMVGGDKLWTYSYLDDITDGLVQTLTQGVTGERYIFGGEHKRLDEFYKLIASLTGKKPLTRNIPYGAASLLGRMLYLWAVISNHEPFVTHEVVDIFKHHWTYDSQKAIQTLGYHITPFETGIQQTVDWIKKKGLAS
jgi:NAD+-dependent farnesol dehydrogenase